MPGPYVIGLQHKSWGGDRHEQQDNAGGLPGLKAQRVLLTRGRSLGLKGGDPSARTSWLPEGWLGRRNVGDQWKDWKEPEGLQGRVGKLDDQQWSAWCAPAAWQQTEPRLVTVGLERKAPGAKHATGSGRKSTKTHKALEEDNQPKTSAGLKAPLMESREGPAKASGRRRRATKPRTLARGRE